MIILALDLKKIKTIINMEILIKHTIIKINIKNMNITLVMIIILVNKQDNL